MNIFDFEVKSKTKLFKREFVDNDGKVVDMQLKICFDDEDVTITTEGYVDLDKDSYWYKYHGMTRDLRYGGCDHDKIAEVFPEVKKFLNLHLMKWKLYNLKSEWDRLSGKKLLTVEEEKELFGIYERVYNRMYEKRQELIEFAETFEP